MKNFQTKIFLAVLILGSAIPTLFAQEIPTLQFMKGLSQSDLFNPALHNDSTKWVVGLPVLSGANYSFNSDFATDKLLHKGTGALSDSLVLDLEKFQASLRSSNTIQQQFSVPYFYLGYHLKKSFFSLVISEKASANLTFNKSLITFLKDGNASYIGQNVDLGNLKVDALQYSEFAFCYSTSLLKDKLTLGLRAKALFGKFALQTEKMDIQVETAPDASYVNLKSDMKINLSAPISVEYDQDGYFSAMKGTHISGVNYMTQTGNMGFAIDFGAVYKLTPKLLLSGSIIDLGKISFKNSVLNLDHSSTYQWTGIDFSKSIDNTSAGYIKPSDLIDAETTKLKDSFRPKNTEFSTEPFKMTIPTKIFLGGTYDITSRFNMGLLDRLYKYGDYSQNSVTLSANALLGKIFSLTGSYSMIGNSSTNLGLGMALRLGAVQIYFVNDNVLAFVNPSNVEVANLRFGINLLFSGKSKVAVN